MKSFKYFAKVFSLLIIILGCFSNCESDEEEYCATCSPREGGGDYKICAKNPFGLTVLMRLEAGTAECLKD